MTLASWLKYIESLHPREIELGLDRVREAAQRLQLDFSGVRLFTVGGTNGKGSCVATLEQVLLAQGLRVGAYTSPHLLRYNERIRIAGKEVSDEQLCAAFAQVEARRGTISLTYFEFGTLAALLLFQQANLQAVVLEVGLGGRLDAVNIMDSDVALVTSIALDHTDWLGDNREAIGREKAGIARAGKPLVCADREPPLSLLEVTTRSGASPLLIGNDFDQHTDTAGRWHWRGKDRQGSPVSLRDLPRPALHPDVVAAALEALCLLDLLPGPQLLAQVLESLKVPGRFEQLIDTRRQRRLILDVAHNPAAAALLASRLQSLQDQRPAAKRGRVIVVMAIMRDKDARGFVQALDSVVDIWYIAQVNQERCMPAQVLAEQMASIVGSQSLVVCPDIISAYESACADSAPHDTVVVTGSFFTVAELKHLLEDSADATPS